MSTHTNALPEGYVISSGNQQYRIVKILGHGGFGITYLASSTIKHGNLSFNVHFAVKEHFLSDSCERDAVTQSVSYSNPTREKVENSKKDFLAEARRLHKVGVDHPNIVKVNEVFEANNTAYYVMEYLEGQSLRGYVEQNGPMTEAGMWAVMTPVINAVAYLHDNRMTHLDIKPDNIMLAKDEEGNIMRPVLIDFGLSKHYTEDGRPTSTLNALGLSNGYSPIEQYAGITTFSPEADVYALGATMLFCLTGKDPVKSTDLKPGDVERMIPAGVSETTAKTIVEAMQMFKAARPSDARALLSEYNPAKVEKKAATVPPVPSPVPTGDSDSGKKTVMVDVPAGKSSFSRKWGIIAVVAVVVVAGIFFILKNDDSNPLPELDAKTATAETIAVDTAVAAFDTVVSVPQEKIAENEQLSAKATDSEKHVADSGNPAVKTDYSYKKLRCAGSVGRMGYVDEKGSIAIPFKYQEAYEFVGERAVVMQKNAYAAIDKNGNIIVPFGKFDSISNFSNGRAGVKRNGKWGYINESGVVCIPLEYDNANPFSVEGRAKVKKNGYYGYINESNEVLIPFEYDDIVWRSNGSLEVKKDGEWKIIRTVGGTVVNKL